jgi:hypothetical protein
MPVWGWILIAAMVIVVVIAGVLVMAMPASRRKRTERLKQKFGPEYERTVSEAGEQQAAEKELVAREHKRDKLDIHPLTAGAREGYAHRWRTVQTAFVDHPSSAVGDADRLVTEVMRERGYPVDDSTSAQPTSQSITRRWSRTTAPLTPSTWRTNRVRSAPRNSGKRSFTTEHSSTSCSTPVTGPIHHTAQAQHRRQAHDYPRAPH